MSLRNCSICDVGNMKTTLTMQRKQTASFNNNLRQPSFLNLSITASVLYVHEFGQCGLCPSNDEVSQTLGCSCFYDNKIYSRLWVVTGRYIQNFMRNFLAQCFVA